MSNFAFIVTLSLVYQQFISNYSRFYIYSDHKLPVSSTNKFIFKCKVWESKYLHHISLCFLRGPEFLDSSGRRTNPRKLKKLFFDTF